MPTETIRKRTVEEIQAELLTLPPIDILCADAVARLRALNGYLSGAIRRSYCAKVAHSATWRGPRAAVLGLTDPRIPNDDLAEVAALAAYPGVSAVADRARVAYCLARGYSVADTEDETGSVAARIYGIARRSCDYGWREAVYGLGHPMLDPHPAVLAAAQTVDSVPAQIARVLLTDPHTTTAELGAQLGMAARSVQARFTAFAREHTPVSPAKQGGSDDRRASSTRGRDTHRARGEGVGGAVAA